MPRSTVWRPSPPRPTHEALSRRRSRSPGCSATRRSRGGRRPPQPGAARAALAATELELSAAGARRARGVVRVSELLVVGHDDVKRLLPMDECIELMATVLADLARGAVWQPLRFVVRPPDEPSLMGLMPAHRSAPTRLLRAEGRLHLPEQRGREGSICTRAACCSSTARPASLRALVDASAVTATRTAAVSAVATRAARSQGRAAPGDPRFGRTGAVAPARRWQWRGRSSTRASGAGHRSTRRRSPPRRRRRSRWRRSETAEEAVAWSRRRRDRDVVAGADRPARVAGDGGARQRGRLVDPDRPRARRRDRRGRRAVRGRAGVDGERGR